MERKGGMKTKVRKETKCEKENKVVIVQKGQNGKKVKRKVKGEGVEGKKGK